MEHGIYIERRADGLRLHRPGGHRTVDDDAYSSVSASILAKLRDKYPQLAVLPSTPVYAHPGTASYSSVFMSANVQDKWQPFLELLTEEYVTPPSPNINNTGDVCHLNQALGVGYIRKIHQRNRSKTRNS